MQKNSSHFIFLAFLVSLIATLGSLFFSEIMNFVPCSLCWYQRICIYPLVIILGLSFCVDDSKVKLYSYPFAFLGLFLALYHNLLQWKIIPETIAPCKQGVPCSLTYINWFGFITIPFLALVAFLLILLFLKLYKAKED